MIRDFDHIPITDEKKPRVGIVGEILVKFLPAANNHLAELLESEGAEPVVPDLIDFFCYCFYNTNFKVEHLGFKKVLRCWEIPVLTDQLAAQCGGCGVQEE